jgi:hypothetical protein
MDKEYIPLYISCALVLICMGAALFSHKIEFPAGIEQFLSGFKLSLGGLLGSLATLVAGRDKRELSDT